MNFLPCNAVGLSFHTVYCSDLRQIVSIGNESEFHKWAKRSEMGQAPTHDAGMPYQNELQRFIRHIRHEVQPEHSLAFFHRAQLST